MSTEILDFIRDFESNYPSFSIHAFQKAMDAVTKHYYQYQEAKSAQPSVELFLKSFYQYRDLNIFDECLSAEAYSDLLTELQYVLSDFMSEMMSPHHQLRLRNLRRSEKRNSASIKSYVDALFAQHAKILVVRVDFHFRDSVTIEEAQEEREWYLRSIKRKYKPLVGYVWKLECGKSREYHYHIAFFFNGNFVQNDIRIGRLLGEAWKAGSYHNCNADKRKYDEWGTYGIGEVHWDDSSKRGMLLDNALNYLLKMDERLLATMFERSRSVGKMEVPHRSRKGGRPRVLRVSLE
ncbi:inovirus Gp2 family protein [Aeromonas veronii]|uniref:YagK/YfjJ domain-containing protein n=1 Tax=Aeromonas veronii TaxID=654 RepID=UPI00226CE618|nr:inovirus-type Gp2 protein [Aeromonas veronii]MCX9134863.1 inovirus Gp2 family protein [Aeromonas veronii]